MADSKRLVDGVLREEWGFQGVVISDWMGTYSTQAGIEAGVDIEMPAPAKWRKKEQILPLIKNQSLSLDAIDKTALRVLTLAKRLGRFDNPEELPECAQEDAERDDFIKHSAADGMVLLKNNEGVLPIPRDGSVAMIGQHAGSLVLGGGGSARVNALHDVSPIKGMQNLGYSIRVAAGVPVFGAVPHADPSLIRETGNEAQSLKPVKIEWYNSKTTDENPVHQEMVAQPEYMIKEKWPDYLNKDYCTRMTFDIIAPCDGDHILSVISTGRSRCLIDGHLAFERPQETKLRPESFYFFKRHLERRFTYPMKAARRYTVQLESWACDPDILNAPPVNGMMFQGSTLRFHTHIDHESLIKEAIDSANACDYAVVCVGTTNEFESEGYDRDTMDLTTAQYDLIDAVIEANPKTVVVNFSGSPVSLTQVAHRAPAIVQAWFPGQEGGDALAAILSGLVNPSGRLPISWPQKIEDNPSFGNFPAQDNLLKYKEGLAVGYRWYDRPSKPDPLFAFGYGLSYSQFCITKAVAEGILDQESSRVSIVCQVENSSNIPGKTVIQVYVQSPQGVPGLARPVKELHAFAKVEICAGGREEVTMELCKDSFGVYADTACWTAFKGHYKVLIGFSSTDISHELDCYVSQTLTWTGV